MGFGIDLEFSADGKHLIIGEDNKKARVFSTETWEEVYEFSIEKGFCGGCLAFVKLQPQSGLLYKAEQKGSLRIYDLEKGQKLRDLAKVPFQINKWTLPKMLVTACWQVNRKFESWMQNQGILF